MRASIGLIFGALLSVPALARGQTEGTPAIAREVFSREVRRAAVPPPVVVEERVVVPERRVVVPERPVVVPERRVVTERVAPARVVTERVVAPATVVERPVVRERVAVATPVVRWWEVLDRARFGYYDDAYFDDNWYYDYYEAPPRTVREGDVLYRTGWFYAPTAERGLFNW
jgi:hypothetical protein